MVLLNWIDFCLILNLLLLNGVTKLIEILWVQNCSGRCDNRIYFARQGSAHQACFMRQVSRPKVLTFTFAINSSFCNLPATHSTILCWFAPRELHLPNPFPLHWRVLMLLKHLYFLDLQ